MIEISTKNQKSTVNHANQVNLSSFEKAELLRLRTNLKNLENFQLFKTVDDDCTVINDFGCFRSLIRQRNQAYEALEFIASKIEDRGLGGAKNPGSEHHIGSLLNSRTDFHFVSYEKLIFKIKGVYDVLKDYLGVLTNDPYQEYSQSLLSDSLENLQNLAKNSENQAEQIGEIHIQFIQIKETLEDQLQSARRNEISSKTETTLKQALTGKRDKSVMTTPLGLDATRAMDTLSNQESIDIEKIQIDVQDNDYANNLLARHNENFTFIAYNNQESFLTTLYGKGIALKKDGEMVYSMQFENDMRYILDVACCKGNYYIHSAYPRGKILRKKNDASEPTVWWDRREIVEFEPRNKNIRVTSDGSALIINVNDTELVVLEVCDDGSAGREIVINNTS